MSSYKPVFLGLQSWEHHGRVHVDGVAQSNNHVTEHLCKHRDKKSLASRVDVRYIKGEGVYSVIFIPALLSPTSAKVPGDQALPLSRAQLSCSSATLAVSFVDVVSFIP